SIANPFDSGAGVSGDAVTQNYVEPTLDPFANPTPDLLYYQDQGGMADGDTYSRYLDSPTDTPAGAVSSGNNWIELVNGAVNGSIDGGAGNDTIGADFGFRQADSGVDVINGNGGQDVITVLYVPTPYDWANGTGIVAPDAAF